jgi:S1-C subfamily serine protease
VRYSGAVLGLLLLNASMIAAQAPDWTHAAELLERAAVKLTYDTEGTCTGVVSDKDRKYIFAAGHCGPDAPKPIYADGALASVIYRENEQDLLVLYSPNLDGKKGQLRLAEDDAKTGDFVASGGYGYGFWHVRIANVANPKAIVPGLVGPFLVVNSGYVPGQSGGPVVNIKGEIVGVVQLASDRVGLGRGAEYIKDKVGRFFGKDTTKP